jgi:hypothetical protein
MEGIGAAHDGTNMGSSINVSDYFLGDFNRDGRRDCPEWPEAPSGTWWAPWAEP